MGGTSGDRRGLVTRRAHGEKGWRSLVVGLAAIVVWQGLFAWNVGPETEPRSKYALQASGGVLEWQPEFVYFLYYLGLYPVASISSESPDFSEEGARRLIAEKGPSLVMDRYWTIRYGDLGKTLLYLPDAWLKGRPVEPSMRPTNAILWTVALGALFAAFWSVGQVLLGTLLVILLGSNPFQVHEVYASNNLFGWPIAITVLVLALHVPLLRDAGARLLPSLLVACATGALLGTVRQVRTESVLVILAAAGAYLTMSRVHWPKRLAPLLVLVLSFGWTSSWWAGYFDAKFREAYSAVKAAGGHTYDGPRQPYHFVWHAIWCGLGDFDGKYGYEWADIEAIRYAWPIMRRAGFVPTGYTPVADRYQGLTLGVYWDPGRQYARTPFETPEYTDVVRKKVLSDIARDPLWYAEILTRRVLRLLTKATPPAVAIGASSATLPGGGAWGVLPVLVIPALIRRRDWFQLKALVFTLPLVFTPLVVYSGGGTVYYSVCHLVALAIVLAMAGEWAHQHQWGIGIRQGRRTWWYPRSNDGSSTGLAKRPALDESAVRGSRGGMARVASFVLLGLIALSIGAWASVRAVVGSWGEAWPPRGAVRTAVLPTRNATGDSSVDWIGDALDDRIAGYLGNSRGHVLGPASVERLLDGRRQAGAGLAVRVACDRSGARHALASQILATEEGLRACVTPFTCSSPEKATEPICAALWRDNVAGVARRLAGKLSAALGEPPGEARRAEESPPDVEALRLYTEAARLDRLGLWGSAFRRVSESLEREPGFGSAQILDARLRMREGFGWAADPARDPAGRSPSPLPLQEALRLLDSPRWAADGLRSLREQLAGDPDSVDLRVDLGRALVGLELWGEAENVLAPLIDEPGAPAEAYGLLAKLHAAQGDFGDGYQILLEEERRTRGEPLGLALQAEHLTRWGQLGHVPGLLRLARAGFRARNLPAQTLDASLRRWAMLALEDQWTRADAVASDMHRLDDPRAAAGLLCLSLSRLREGRSRFALALAEEAAARLERQGLDPSPATRMVGEILLERGQPADALEALGRHRRDQGVRRRGLPLLHLETVALARLSRWSEAAEARRHLARDVERMPGPSGPRRLHHLDGELALLRGDTTGAIDVLARADRLLPPRGYCGDHVPIWYALARAHLTEERPDAAESWLRRVAESSTESLCWPIPYVRSFFLLGQLRRTLGDEETATRDFERFLELWGEGDLATAEQTAAAGGRTRRRVAARP